MVFLGGRFLDREICHNSPNMCQWLTQLVHHGRLNGRQDCNETVAPYGYSLANATGGTVSSQAPTSAPSGSTPSIYSPSASSLNNTAESPVETSAPPEGSPTSLVHYEYGYGPSALTSTSNSSISTGTTGSTPAGGISPSPSGSAGTASSLSASASSPISFQPTYSFGTYSPSTASQFAVVMETVIEGIRVVFTVTSGPSGAPKPSSLTPNSTSGGQLQAPTSTNVTPISLPTSYTSQSSSVSC